MRSKIKIIASGLMLCAGSSAYAELYVSPIVRESSVSIVSDAPAPVQQQVMPSSYAVSKPLSVVPMAKPVASVNPAPAVASAPIAAVAPAPIVNVAAKAAGLFGKSVPLSIAAKNLAPTKYWIVNIEDGLGNRMVSWKDADGYADAFRQIERTGSVSVTINNAETAIGIGSSKKMADAMAKRNPSVYTIDVRKSLRKNLEAWAAQNNWTVAYQEGLTADYEDLGHATLFLPFEGKDGAADQLLKGTWDKKVKLECVFKTGNRTLYIKEKGFDRVNKLEPSN
ncbi:hypothetical protein RYA05_04915 [Pseudomonas syringae pv. actinidiae]|nr:hypothetical protein [Pseudomonas syringae pv. actinidiae]